MATIEEYGSGRILKLIQRAHLALACTGVPLAGPALQKNLEKRMRAFEIRPITMHEAETVIGSCRHCAVGPRICQPLFPTAAATESVFLDELADRLVEAGQARGVSQMQAVEALTNYPANPLLLSRVSGRYLEICRSEPSVCIYWKMRRKGMDV